MGLVYIIDQWLFHSYSSGYVSFVVPCVFQNVKQYYKCKVVVALAVVFIMFVSDPNNVKIYNLSAGKSLPEVCFVRECKS